MVPRNPRKRMEFGRARELRRKGWPLKKIAAELLVSPSIVLLWTEDIILSVYTNNGLTIDQIERYWLNLLELPKACIRKHTLNHMPTSSSGRARGRLPYGVCTLAVNSTEVVQHIYGAIQEYGGFEEPAWLDG